MKKKNLVTMPIQEQGGQAFDDGALRRIQGIGEIMFNDVADYDVDVGNGNGNDNSVNDIRG